MRTSFAQHLRRRGRIVPNWLKDEKPVRIPGAAQISVIPPHPHRRLTHDGMYTLDRSTYDATGAFLVGELEKLDQELHMPLMSVTWQRDIKRRRDVTSGDEVSSYTNSTFATPPGVAGSNKSWIGKNTTSIPGAGLDIGKTANPLGLWAFEVGWNQPELESAMRLGRPIETQQLEAMRSKWEMDIDEQTYIGDSALGITGMLNHVLMTNVSNATNGSWATATSAQIIQDFNNLLLSVFQATALAVLPTDVLLDVASWNILNSTIVSTAGNVSILKYLEENNLTKGQGGKLRISTVKWLTGTNNTIGGITGKSPYATNSMMAYVNEERRIRIPIVDKVTTPIQYSGLQQKMYYWGRIGCVEMVYPECAAVRENLG